MAVEVIATIKPKNNGKFPIVEAVDVDVNGKPLSEALNEFGNGNTPKFELRNDNELFVSYDNGENFEYLATLPKGDRGPQGPRGPQGEQGPQGPQGEQGEKGADGTSVSIKPSALECTVVGDAYIDVGTGHLMILTVLPSTFTDAGEIKGPKGDKGDTGATGAQGPQGEKGDKGDPGNITINGKGELRFYVGETEEEFNNEVEDKTNVFAIIDDPEEGSLIGRINGFLDGSIPVPSAEKAKSDGNGENIEETYVKKADRKVTTIPLFNRAIKTGFDNKIYLDNWWNSKKTLNDIIGACMTVDLTVDGITTTFNYTATKCMRPTTNGNGDFVGFGFVSHTIPSSRSFTQNSINAQFYLIDNILWLSFSSGAYSWFVFVEDGTLGSNSRHHDIGHGGFTISEISFWFA